MDVDSENQDIRWQQRFENYQKALVRLNKAVALSEERELTNLEKMGTLGLFKGIYDVACKTIENYFRAKGERKIYGPRNAIRLAKDYGLIQNYNGWIEMLSFRQNIFENCAEDIINSASKLVVSNFIRDFQQFDSTMLSIKNQA